MVDVVVAAAVLLLLLWLLLSLLQLLLFVITFMQCVYNCVPKTNNASWVHSVVGILYLRFMVHVMYFVL